MENVTDGGMERGVRPIWEEHWVVVVKGCERAVRWRGAKEEGNMEGMASLRERQRAVFSILGSMR